MKISKYIKLGIVIVFSITLFIWGLSYLKGHDFFKPVNYYYTRYHRVDGLQESSPVTVNGYRVGNVKNIEFADDESGDLIVTFMIDNDFRIPRNSAAHIVSSDIMGTRAVKLIYSKSTGYYAAGDTIPGEMESDIKEQVSLQVLPLKNKAEELLSTIDSAITVLTVIFNEDARKNLSESFANINRAILNIENTTSDLQELMSQQKSNISSLIGNMEEFSGSLNRNSAHFNNIIDNLSSFSDTLSSLPLTPVMSNLSASVNSLQNILSKINSDKTTAGLLFNDDVLYHNITSLTANLERLLVDIRNNPKRYLRFSAVDLGKDVYISPSATAQGSADNIRFRIQLLSTADRLVSESPVFEGLEDVEELNTNGTYTYYAGNTSDFTVIEKMLTDAKRNFPDATIVAFREGKEIKLQKALRLMKELP